MDCESAQSYRVRQGSGMGMRHSGAVSDLALINDLEEGFVDKANFLEELGVQGYIPFRDDVLVAISSMSKIWHLKRTMKNRCSYMYNLEFKNFARDGIPFLDLWVYKHEGDGVTRSWVGSHGQSLRIGLYQWPLHHCIIRRCIGACL